MATLVIDSLVDIEKATAVFSMKQSKFFLSFLPSGCGKLCVLLRVKLPILVPFSSLSD